MLRSLLLLTALTLAPQAFAYYSVLDTGEILQKGHYKLTGNVQFLTERESGANAAGRFDMGIDDEFGVRAILGFGEVDFFGGAMVRWVPIPDTEDQPSVGVNVGILYGKNEDVRDLTFRVEPVVSKRFDIGNGILTPYGSLPLGVRFRDSDTDDDNNLTWQLVVGSQLQLPTLKKVQFIAELGLDLSKAPSYVTLGALLYFDEENGIVIE